MGEKKKFHEWGRADGDITKVWSHKHDFPIEEIWETYHVLSQIIVNRLYAFKQLEKHGCPVDFNDIREWNNAIQKMIDAFELMKYVNSLSDREKKTVDEGLSLFCKYFCNLWD